jgi:hypothetical protein
MCLIEIFLISMTNLKQDGYVFRKLETPPSQNSSSANWNISVSVDTHLHKLIR